DLGDLSDGDGGDGIILGLLELCGLSLLDRRRHWRGIHGNQLGDPGTDTGAVSRAYRSGDQRQLLARRGIGRGWRHRLSAAGRLATGLGLARRVWRRFGAWPDHCGPAPIYPGEPALAAPACPL